MVRLAKDCAGRGACSRLGLPGLSLVIVLALVTLPLAAAQFSVALKAGGAPAGTGVNHSQEWLALDAQLDLTGLWPSLNTFHDKDPDHFSDAATGTDHLVWAQWSGVQYRIVHARRAPGQIWDAPEAVEQSAGSTLDNVVPRGLVDSQGLVHVTWARRGNSSGHVFHAVRVSLGWTAPGLISTEDLEADVPQIWEENGETLLDYETPLDLVHMQVEVVGYSGGSDDVDPTEITVNSWEIGRSLIPN